jgi:hypothetical protein
VRAFCEVASHRPAPTGIFRLVAGERDDEPGVMGNLPRSRPGRRSAKRGGSSTRAKTPAPPKKRAAATRTSAAAKKKPAPRARPQAQRTRPAPAPPAANKGNDPVGQAVELAGKVAALGVRTAAGIVKRLPRP